MNFSFLLHCQYQIQQLNSFSVNFLFLNGLKIYLFDHYFNQCAPQSCQHSYTKQYDLIYVLTTLIGLFGGLTTGLRFLVYYTGLIIFKIIDRYQKRKQVALQSNQTVAAPAANESNENDIEVISNPITSIRTVQVMTFYSVNFLSII